MSGERDRNVMVVGADDPAPSRSVRAAVRNRTDLLLVGDAETTLTRVPTGVVQTVITSPPYWSLRDYEAEGQIGMAEPLPIFIKSLVGVFDTTVTIPGGEPLRISLKSSAARDMKTDRVHISKLTEAAWIQDARTQSARRKHIVDLFRDYRATTDLIMMVRCFSIENGGRYQYELVEIPTSLFASVDLVDIELAQKSTIGIPPGAKPPEAKIRVDRSDAKITLTDIRLDLCVVHGRWTVENLSGRELTPEA